MLVPVTNQIPINTFPIPLQTGGMVTMTVSTTTGKVINPPII